MLGNRFDYFKKERQLDLMKEHRKSLIYEYVTGKKRVGGVDYGN